MGIKNTSADRRKTQVLIVDDHRAFADSLGIAIDLQPDLEQVGTASTVEEALAVIDRTPPSVVLMDLRLPGANGIEGIRLIKQAHPRIHVLMLTGFADAEALASAASAGASGFFPKERPVGEILEAIRAANDGGMLVEPSILTTVLERVRPPSVRTRGVPTLLTERQSEVLGLLAEGLDPRAIARRLGISLNTTRGHVKSVLAKLGVHSQLEAVVEGMRLGLLHPSVDLPGRGGAEDR